MTPPLTSEERILMRHALGFTRAYGSLPKKNEFCCARHEDALVDMWRVLVLHGFAEEHEGVNAKPVFTVTTQGMDALGIALHSRYRPENQWVATP